MTCLAVVCRAVLLGTFVLAGFLVASAFETTTAGADTGCGPIEAVTVCPVTTSVTSLVDATVGQSTTFVDSTAGQATALVDSTTPAPAPAIGQVDSAVRTATTATTAVAQTVDTVVRDAGTTVSRTLDDPITNALSGSLTGAVSGTLARTVSAIAPVVPGSVLQPLPALPDVVATVSVSVSEVSTSSPTRPQPAPPVDAGSAAPRTTPAVAPQVSTTPAAPRGGGLVFGVSGQHGQVSFQWSTASAAQAGIGSQRPVGHLPLDFPAAPVGAVGSGNGTSQAGSSGGHAQGATVLPGRAAHDQRLASWSVDPDDVARLRKLAQQPPVSPD